MRLPALACICVVALAFLMAQAANTQGVAGGTAIKWSDYPLAAKRSDNKSKNGQRSTYTCPPNGTASPSGIIGTDIYTDDSSICLAAVHAGLISFASGGTVTVEVRIPGPNRYTGSTRNGVTSRGYDNGANPTQGAFVFIGGGSSGGLGNTSSGGGGRSGNTGGGGGDVFGPMENNYALNGTNLTYYPRPSVDECLLDCANNANCRGFTWIRAGTYNPTDAAMCYLIAVVTGRSYVAGHISAVKGSGSIDGGGNAGGGGSASPGGNTGATGNTGGRGGNTGGGGGDVFGPMENNYALNGTNLTYYPRPSVDECLRDCANNANCRGFTWIRAGTYSPTDAAMCYLIAVVTGRSYVAGHISAVKGGGGASAGGNTGATGNTGGPTGAGSSGGTSQVCRVIYQNNGTIFGGADARGPLVVRPNVQARVVHLEVPANTFLNLDAVMIFDSTGANVALNKPARQSSNSPWTQPNGAQGAVDGHKPDGGYHIHTNIDQNNPSWWEVDLQQVYPIAEIRVYNRIDIPDRAKYLKICVK